MLKSYHMQYAHTLSTTQYIPTVGGVTKKFSTNFENGPTFLDKSYQNQKNKYALQKKQILV